MKCLIDTDVLIDYLRGLPQAVEFLRSLGGSICFSTITVAEVYCGVKGNDEEEKIKELFVRVPVVPVDLSIAREAGRLVAAYHKSHKLSLPDALIAASCLQTGASLQTLNVRHYPMFAGLSPPYGK